MLHQLEFELRRGRTTAVMGPGGAGKSTLLKLLAGDPLGPRGFWSEGVLRRDFDSSPGLLSQSPDNGSRSLVEKLPAHRAEDGATGPAAAERLASRRVHQIWGDFPEAERLLLATLDLPLGRLPLELRRLAELTVAFAGVSESSTPVLILDEPESEVDDKVAGWIEALLSARRGSASIVIATHHLGLARRVSDDVLLLIEGKQMAWGPTRRIFEDPTNERTRMYLRMGS